MILCYIACHITLFYSMLYGKYNITCHIKVKQASFQLATICQICHRTYYRTHVKRLKPASLQPASIFNINYITCYIPM